MTKFLVVLLLTLVSSPAYAQLNVHNVADGIYALVGPLGNRGPGNLGNNATFGVVVTDAGVVLIDPGATYKGAAKIDTAMKTITDQPVRIVINSGGQDHRWIGNSYWLEQGARIIASADAVADQAERESLQLNGLDALIGEHGYTGTNPIRATETFTDHLTLSLGGITLEVYHTGAAHTPGDSFVWVPSQSAVFTGDIVYTERLLGVTPVSDTIQWIAAFEAIEALSPEHIIPGHGRPTDILTAASHTYDYLVNLREQMALHIQNGGDIIGAVEVDQSAFTHLQNFDLLARRNAQTLFEAMEWE